MSPVKVFRIIFLIAIALTGLTFGRLSHRSIAGAAKLSSETGSVSVNSFATLPCPSEEKYKELAAKVSLEILDGKATCDDSNRAKLGKILLLMDQLRMQAPATWLPEVQAELGDLLGYVARHSKHLGLDLTQANSIAYNLANEQSIYLGGYFFGASPLEDVSTLIHESRHSAPGASRHVQCRGGDIPLTQDGCDEEFSISAKDAGAYSYEVMLLAGLSLYANGLSAADREYLMSSALTMLAGRFNVIPSEAAEKTDVLMALDQNGKVYTVDVVKNIFKPIPLKLMNSDEKIVRLAFNHRDSGALLFSNKKRLYAWNSWQGFYRYQPGLITDDLRVTDVARLMLSGESGRTRMTYKTASGVYKVSRLLPGKTKMELVDMIPQKNLKNYPSFSSYFMAWYGDGIFLTADGRAALMSHEVAPDKWFSFPDGLQDSRGWRQGTGGVVYEDLFLLNRAGELKVGQATYEELNDTQTRTTYRMENHEFRVPGRAMKYFQGLKYHAAMNEEGHITVRPYGSGAKAIEVRGRGIVDFTIIHNPVLKTAIVPK